MSILKSEKELQKYWKEKLKEQYKEVFANVNLSSHKFKENWISWWGLTSPPSQPEIDIIVVDKNFELYAIELKYLVISKKKVNRSFYTGIEQALALLTFGFNCVNLWHCFDKDFPKYIYGQYESSVKNLIKDLKLPIDYQALYMDKYKDRIKAYPIINGEPFIIEIKETGYRAEPVIQPINRVSNPLKFKENSKKKVDSLRRALNIPGEGLG